MKKLEEYVRSIPDFPEPGIIFRDVTSILQDADGLHMAVDSLIDMVKDLDYDLVIGPESRGFIFGVPVAYADMPEKTRTIFMLSRYENKSYKEIAVLMNITPKGVDFHINKALKMLQTNLKDYFPLFLYFFMKCH